MSGLPLFPALHSDGSNLIGLKGDLMHFVTGVDIAVPCRLQALSPGTCMVAARAPDAWSAAIAVTVTRFGVGWHLRVSPAFVLQNWTAESLHVLLTGTKPRPQATGLSGFVMLQSDGSKAGMLCSTLW